MNDQDLLLLAAYVGMRKTGETYRSPEGELKVRLEGPPIEQLRKFAEAVLRLYGREEEE